MRHQSTYCPCFVVTYDQLWQCQLKILQPDTHGRRNLKTVLGRNVLMSVHAVDIDHGPRALAVQERSDILGRGPGSRGGATCVPARALPID